MVKTIEKDHPDKSSSTIVNKSQVKNDIYDFAMNHAKKLKKKKTDKIDNNKDSIAEDDSVKEESDGFYGMSAAEKRHALAQKARLEKDVQGRLKSTYKERAEKLNKHLASLSQHFDQPRISG